MKSKGNEFAIMKAIIEEMKSSKASLAHDVDSDITSVKVSIEEHKASMETDAAVAKANKEAAEDRLSMLGESFVSSVHAVQDEALSVAYQTTIQCIDKAIAAILDAERLVSDGNDVLSRFDSDVAPLVSGGANMHFVNLRNEILRSADDLAKFRESIEDGREYETVKESA